MAKIQLDPRAAQAIDGRGDAILESVSRLATEPVKQSWTPEVAVAATLGEIDIIGRIDVGQVDVSGAQVAVEFNHEGRRYGLMGKEYQAVHAVVAMFLKDRDVRSKVSKRTLEALVRGWIVKRYVGEIKEALAAYASSEFDASISAFRVWVPIDQLYLQRPIQLGLAEIREISSAMLQEIADGATSEEGRARFEAQFRPYQGHAAIIVNWEGDRIRAREAALEVAESTLGALSLLSPAASHCEISSGACLWGSKRVRQATSIYFSDGKMVGSSKGVLGPMPQSQALDNASIQHFTPILRALHLLLTADSSRTLASKVIDSLKVYYRGISSPDPAEKLIYVFVALEMILLRDSNEAIQDSMATRMAFLVGRSIEERRSIIAKVKAGYALRSAFIHHGVQVEDVTAANEFLNVAWHSLVQLLGAAQQHRDQGDLIKALDDRKLQ
jgi:hypothetical protein